MPKKQKRTEQEIHNSIVQDSKIRLGCSDFEPDFSLRESHDNVANWDVLDARNMHEWPPDCAQAFKDGAQNSVVIVTVPDHASRALRTASPSLSCTSAWS